MAKTVKEQIESLPVLDSLKRVESPLAGEWETGGASNTGACSATGWGQLTELVNSGAKRKVALDISKGFLLAATVAKLTAINQTFELYLNSGAGIYIRRTGTSTAEFGLFTSPEVVKTLGGVTIGEGMRVAFSQAIDGTVTAWIKLSGGSWTEVINGGAKKEVPTGSKKPLIFIAANSVAGKAGVISDLSAKAMESEESTSIQIPAPLHAHKNPIANP